MPPVGRAVASRTLNPIVGQPVTTTYEYSETPRAGAMAQTIETDAYGNNTVHKFTLDYPYGPNVCGAEETATQWYQGSSNGGTSGTVLKEVDTSYTYEMNPQDDVTDTWRSHINVLPQSSVSYNYDPLFTASQAYQDFGPGNPQVMPTTSPIRYEVPTYVNDGIGQTVTTREATVNSAYQAAGFVALPQSVTQYDENWNQIATTTYAYDEPTCSPSGTFGNLTSITRDYGTKTSWCYDTQAMQTSTTNPNGNAWGGNGTTSYTYDAMDQVTQALYGGNAACVPSQRFRNQVLTGRHTFATISRIPQPVGRPGYRTTMRAVYLTPHTQYITTTMTR